MILVADEGVDWPIVQRLRLEVHSVYYIAEMAAGMEDEAVLDLALAQDGLLLTNDKDFGEIVFRQRRASAGVVLLRLAGLPAEIKARLVKQVVDEHGNQLLGSFTVVTRQRVRIRPAR